MSSFDASSFDVSSVEVNSVGVNSVHVNSIGVNSVDVSAIGVPCVNEIFQICEAGTDPLNVFNWLRMGVISTLVSNPGNVIPFNFTLEPDVLRII